MHFVETADSNSSPFELDSETMGQGPWRGNAGRVAVKPGHHLGKKSYLMIHDLNVRPQVADDGVSCSDHTPVP